MAKDGVLFLKNCVQLEDFVYLVVVLARNYLFKLVGKDRFFSQLRRKGGAFEIACAELFIRYFLVGGE